MPMTENDKRARLNALTEAMASLGVKTSKDHIRGWLNTTCTMDTMLWLQALAELVRNKSDGYATFPQPGELWAKASGILIGRGEGEYSPGQGQLPPRYFRDQKRDNARLTRSWEASGAIESAAAVPKQLNAIADGVLADSRSRSSSRIGTVDSERVRDLLGDPTAPRHGAFGGEKDT